MTAQRRAIAVIGLGTFGSAVATELSRLGDHVLGIDADEARVAAMSSILHRAIIADARDELAMSEIGLDSYDIAVVAVASDLESSILSLMNARAQGVREVWAKAASATHARILENLDVERILQPEQQFGNYVAYLLHNPAVRDYVILTTEEHLATIVLPERFNKRYAHELPLGKKQEIKLLGIIRDDCFQSCDLEQPLQSGDALLLIGPRESIRLFADLN